MSLEFARPALTRIDADVSALTEAIVAGTAPDWTAYKALLAERRGLLRARERITEAFSDEERKTFNLDPRT